MTAAVAPLAHRVAVRAQKDTRFAKVLDALLTAPTSPQGTLERIAGRTLSDQRRVALVEDFVDGSMRTPEVQALLKLRTPQAVHRLRSRGKLIGSAVGNQTCFPAWQFDGGRMRSDLSRILELLARFTSDPLAADRIMRLKNDELGDTSIADALRKPKTAEVAWQMLTSLGAAKLPAGYLVPFADDRPVGLRRRSIPAGSEMWRVDASPPAAWDWTGYPEPRHRFDPQSGAFRTRYAGATLVGAFRERYRSTGLVIPADHRTHHLVRLVAARNLRVLDLRTEKNLDVLQVDDQISTGQHPDVWATCHRLVDAARRWWTDIDAIVYRSRTTPESSLNCAFFDEGFDAESWPLGERVDVLTALVLHEGFTVNWDFDVD